MTDRILTDFLQTSHERAMELAAASDILELTPVDHLHRYIADYRCVGLIRTPEGEVLEGDRFVVGIRFPENYLRGPIDTFSILTWLGPGEVWHPNIAFGAPFICVGRIEPGTLLTDILFQVYDVVRWANRTPNEHDALNHAACQWARHQPRERFPIDTRPLRQRAPRSLPVGTPAPEKEEPDA